MIAFQPHAERAYKSVYSIIRIFEAALNVVPVLTRVSEETRATIATDHTGYNFEFYHGKSSSKPT